jgi:hypothetical protein
MLLPCQSACNPKIYFRLMFSKHFVNVGFRRTFRPIEPTLLDLVPHCNDQEPSIGNSTGLAAIGSGAVKLHHYPAIAPIAVRYEICYP